MFISAIREIAMEKALIKLGNVMLLFNKRPKIHRMCKTQSFKVKKKLIVSLLINIKVKY